MTSVIFLYSTVRSKYSQWYCMTACVRLILFKVLTIYVHKCHTWSNFVNKETNSTVVEYICYELYMSDVE